MQTVKSRPRQAGADDHVRNPWGRRVAAPPACLGTRVDQYRCCLPALAGFSGYRREGPAGPPGTAARCGHLHCAGWGRRSSRGSRSIQHFQTWRREGDSLGALRLALAGGFAVQAAFAACRTHGGSLPLRLRRAMCTRRKVYPALSNLAERGGFEPPKRGLDAYTLSRRAPSTTRTPLRWNPRRRPQPETRPAMITRCRDADKQRASAGCAVESAPARCHSRRCSRQASSLWSVRGNMSNSRTWRGSNCARSAMSRASDAALQLE